MDVCCGEGWMSEGGGAARKEERFMKCVLGYEMKWRSWGMSWNRSWDMKWNGRSWGMEWNRSLDMKWNRSWGMEWNII